MVLSGISCFFLWFGTSESMMIGMLCLYNGLTISAWNSLDVVTVELYPTDRRYVEMVVWEEGLSPTGPLKAIEKKPNCHVSKKVKLQK